MQIIDVLNLFPFWAAVEISRLAENPELVFIAFIGMHAFQVMAVFNLMVLALVFKRLTTAAFIVFAWLAIISALALMWSLSMAHFIDAALYFVLMVFFSVLSYGYAKVTEYQHKIDNKQPARNTHEQKARNLRR